MDLELSRETALITSDEEEIVRHFSRYIAFGTGGSRGRMGAGTALINTELGSGLEISYFKT